MPLPGVCSSNAIFFGYFEPSVYSKFSSFFLVSDIMTNHVLLFSYPFKAGY